MRTLRIILGLCLFLLTTLSIFGQASRYSSQYQNPAVYDGLYYLVNSRDEFDTRALVISYNNKPIPPKANELEAPTKPGFYLSYKEGLEFERIEVLRRKVYFKTRRLGGVSYVFVGRSGWKIYPEFDPSIPIPFIKGTLTKFRNGRVIKRGKAIFSHAVIA